MHTRQLGQVGRFPPIPSCSTRPADTHFPSKRPRCASRENEPPDWPGTIVLLAQVRSDRSPVPNLRPAMNRTLSQVGNCSTCWRSRKSQDSVSTPCFSRSSRAAFSENRETAITRCPTPAASKARRARNAKDGPILPPAPRTIMPPLSRRAHSMSAAFGLDSNSSNCSSVAMDLTLAIDIGLLMR